MSAYILHTNLMESATLTASAAASGFPADNARDNRTTTWWKPGDSTTTWTPRGNAVDHDWFCIAWSPELGMFAAVAFSGTGNRVMTSVDGVTWTSRTSAADNNWRSIAWSPELGLFAAVADTGTGNRVMTSVDGVTWTSRTSADNDWRSIAWSPELGMFAAVALTGTDNRVMTSVDGVTWTIRASAADNNWFGIAWSPELGMFAAVSSTGTGNRVMTSSGNTQTVVVHFTTAKTVKSFGVIGHNLGTSKATITLQYLSGTYQTLFTVTPTTDLCIFKHDTTGASSNTWKIEITNCNQYTLLAVASIGVALALPSEIPLGFSAPKYARDKKIMNNKTEGGKFIGRSVINSGVEFEVSQRHVTNAWMDANYDTLMDRLEIAPCFFSWDYTNYPNNPVFAYLSEAKIQAPRYTNPNLQDFTLKFNGELS